MRQNNTHDDSINKNEYERVDTAAELRGLLRTPGEMTLKCKICEGVVEITETTDSNEDPYFELYQCTGCLSEGYIRKKGDEWEYFGCLADDDDYRRVRKTPSPVHFDSEDEDEDEESYEVEAGSDDRTWTVVPLDVEQRTAEFRVHYPDKDKTQTVEIDRYGLNHDCSGTYFEYHSTCPHVQACEKVVDEQY